MTRCRRNLRKLAGCVIGIPTYPSRGKASTFFQSTRVIAVKRCRNASCELPAASTTRQQSRCAIAFRIVAAACSAAARARVAGPVMNRKVIRRWRRHLAGCPRRSLPLARWPRTRRIIQALPFCAFQTVAVFMTLWPVKGSRRGRHVPAAEPGLVQNTTPPDRPIPREQRLAGMIPFAAECNPRFSQSAFH